MVEQTEDDLRRRLRYLLLHSHVVWIDKHWCDILASSKHNVFRVFIQKQWKFMLMTF